MNQTKEKYTFLIGKNILSVIAQIKTPTSLHSPVGSCCISTKSTFCIEIVYMTAISTRWYVLSPHTCLLPGTGVCNPQNQQASLGLCLQKWHQWLYFVHKNILTYCKGVKIEDPNLKWATIWDFIIIYLKKMDGPAVHMRSKCVKHIHIHHWEWKVKSSWLTNHHHLLFNGLNFEIFW